MQKPSSDLRCTAWQGRPGCLQKTALQYRPHHPSDTAARFFLGRRIPRRNGLVASELARAGLRSGPTTGHRDSSDPPSRPFAAASHPSGSELPRHRVPPHRFRLPDESASRGERACSRWTAKRSHNGPPRWVRPTASPGLRLHRTRAGASSLATESPHNREVPAAQRSALITDKSLIADESHRMSNQRLRKITLPIE